MTVKGGLSFDVTLHPREAHSLLSALLSRCVRNLSFSWTNPPGILAWLSAALSDSVSRTHRAFCIVLNKKLKEGREGGLPQETTRHTGAQSLGV